MLVLEEKVRVIPYCIGKSRTERETTSKQTRPHSTSKASAKYLWQRLKVEFTKCLKKYNFSDPLFDTDVELVLTELGYLPKVQHTKVVKGKEYIVEKQLVKKILNVIKLSKSVASDIYGIDDNYITTLDRMRALLIALWGDNFENKDIPTDLKTKALMRRGSNQPQPSATNLLDNNCIEESKDNIKQNNQSQATLSQDLYDNIIIL